MKKLLSLLTAIALMLTLAGCGEKETPVVPEVEVKPITTEVKSNGYGGEIVLNVTTEGEKLVDIELVSDHETAPVFKRSFPLIKERILTAQTPIVDNVSGATFSSWAVKKAVGEVMDKECGTSFGQININTVPAAVEKKQLEDATCDLVIVGGGPAGLAAAITASENGVKDIILVEKLDILSGNGKFDMNFFDHFNSKATRETGENLTKEEFIASYDGYYDSKERMQRWADTGWTLDDWFRGMDIELNYSYGGTSHLAEADEYSGDHIQTGLENALAKTNVDVRTGTKGTDLIITDGVATGVKVENKEGYYNINAKAVIVATGGFSWNKELLKEYRPDYNGYDVTKFMTSNQMGATGDFVPVFKQHNLKLDQMSKLSVFTNILDPRRDLTGGGDVYIRVDADGKEAPKSPDRAFFLTNKEGFDSFYRIRKHVNAGYYKQADTLEGLAKELGINYTNLVETIKEYNATWGPEGYTEFDMEKGPFYGAAVVSAIHMTKGGVVANENAQVINNDNEVVPGLFAAGEVTATDGCYNAAVVFGRVSGEEAAKFVNAK